jgi:hypothetical protein
MVANGNSGEAVSHACTTVSIAWKTASRQKLNNSNPLETVFKLLTEVSNSGAVSSAKKGGYFVSNEVYIVSL